MTDIRFQTILALQEVLEKKTFVGDVRYLFDSASAQDIAFADMLLRTSLRHLVYIKKILKSLIKKKQPSSARFAYYALIVATCEIIYMHTPDYAVINSYVELTKNHLNKFIGGFVNAVLRNICRNQQEYIAADNNDFFPNDFRGLINNSYGRKIAKAIETAALSEPALDLTAKSDFTLPDSVTMPLGTIRLKNHGNITHIDGFAEGLWWVQDFSSALPVNILKYNFPNLQNKKVLDLCAAPGGKTAQLINHGCRVTALDISESRLEKLRANLARLQFQAENIICTEASSFLKASSPDRFDIILLDAPCSATGTLRRHPELVHIKSAEDVHKMADTQKEILNLCPSKLNSQGLLIYCTCSLCKEEGEHQIQDFLSEHPDFKILKPQLPQELSELLTKENFIRILPSSLKDYQGADGFFIAFLTKDK